MKVHTVAAWVAALFLASSVFSHTVALRLTLLGTGFVLSAIALFRDPQQVRALPPIWLPFLVWGAWAALSLLWSIEPERTLKEWRNEVFYTGTALWVCYVAAQAGGAMRIFLWVLGGAAATACAIALYSFSRGWEHYSAGWHGGPGDHSSALLTFMPCVLLVAWYGKEVHWPFRRQILVSMLGVLLLVSAYLTHNRTIWIGFGVQALVVGALMLWHWRRFIGLRGKILAGSIALLVLAIGGTSAAFVKVQTLRKSADLATRTEDVRIALWAEIMDEASERPLTGHGFGRGLLRGPLTERFGAIDTNLWHAHNVLLDTLVQLGIPGLAIFVALLVMLLREGWRAAAHLHEAEAAACGIALIAVIAGMIVRNMTDTLLVRQNALLFWGVAGALLAFAGKTWRRSN